MYKEGYIAAISEYDRHCTIKYSEYAMGSTDLGLSLTINRYLRRSQREKGSDEFYRGAVIASSKLLCGGAAARGVTTHGLVAWGLRWACIGVT